jgi:diguanylate cyclase (GGDEF)-like protein
MHKPAIPLNENLRLAALQNLKLLDTLPAERFDNITRLASRLLNVPISLISLLDRDRQWFKSRHGFDVCETSRDASFCGHTILGEETLVIPDSLKDIRFANNPLVINDPGIRFYAGHAIHSADGFRIGTLCVIDRAPRELSPQDLSLLVDLAEMVDREISLMALATMDELTGLFNRRGFHEVARHVLALCGRHGETATLISIDLDGFKAINDTFGHAEGDEVLRKFSSLLLKHFRASEIVARLGGDEFCILASGATAAQMEQSLVRLTNQYADSELAKKHPELSWSCGYTEFDYKSDTSIDQLVENADKQMYWAKSKTRLQVRSTSNVLPFGAKR